MAVLSIFGASYCGADRVAETVARKLGYNLLSDDDVVTAASREHRVDKSTLDRALRGSPSLLDRFTHERSRCVALLRATLAGQVRQDNAACHGFVAHLLPTEVSHVLRVCLAANQDHRVKTAAEAGGISDAKARTLVRKDDADRARWTEYLFDRGPYDEALYDILIPMHATSVEEAADLIVQNAAKPALVTTPKSRKALDDFAFAARVNIALAEKGFDVEVTADGGNVTVGIKQHALRLKALKERIGKIASDVPGVKNVQVRFSPRYKRPPMYTPYEYELPKKILLVDDEKEFVQTLSERLRAREMPSTIAYDGEQALDQVAKDEPDVIILDLKMPGIDGMEVLRKVKRERPNVEVIILTGHGSEKDRALAEELGAYAYLEKPVDINVLTQTMKEAYAHLIERRSSDEES